MSKAQRKPYDDKVAEARKQSAKMTSEGLDVEMLEMEDRREHQKVLAMKEEISFNLKTAAKSGRK